MDNIIENGFMIARSKKPMTEEILSRLSTKTSYTLAQFSPTKDGYGYAWVRHWDVRYKVVDAHTVVCFSSSPAFVANFIKQLNDVTDCKFKSFMLPLDYSQPLEAPDVINFEINMPVKVSFILLPNENIHPQPCIVSIDTLGVVNFSMNQPQSIVDRVIELVMTVVEQSLATPSIQIRETIKLVAEEMGMDQRKVMAVGNVFETMRKTDTMTPRLLARRAGVTIDVANSACQKLVEAGNLEVIHVVRCTECETEMALTSHELVTNIDCYGCEKPIQKVTPVMTGYRLQKQKGGQVNAN